MKTIIKLIIAALVLHATWRAGTVYMRYYQFTDDVTQVAQFGTNQTDSQLRSGVINAAKRLEIPLDPEAIIVRRENYHIIIEAPYVEQIELAPRYFYPWHARLHVDVLTLVLQQAQ